MAARTPRARAHAAAAAAARPRCAAVARHGGRGARRQGGSPDGASRRFLGRAQAAGARRRRHRVGAGAARDLSYQGTHLAEPRAEVSSRGDAHPPRTTAARVVVSFSLATRVFSQIILRRRPERGDFSRLHGGAQFCCPPSSPDRRAARGHVCSRGGYRRYGSIGGDAPARNDKRSNTAR